MKVKCLQCQKEFVPEVRKKRNTIQKYCSRKCFDDSRIQFITKRCLYCQKEFIVRRFFHERRFCSQRCSNQSRISKFIQRMCPICFKMFIVKAKSKQRYCSRQCVWKLKSKRSKITKEQLNQAFKNYPVDEIANYLGVHHSTVSRWRREFQLPKLSIVRFKLPGHLTNRQKKILDWYRKKNRDRYYQRPKDIAKDLNLNPSHVSHDLKVMVEMGLFRVRSFDKRYFSYKRTEQIRRDLYEESPSDYI